MDEDDKGVFEICPVCGKKAYYRPLPYDGWVCECDCGCLIDED